LKKAYKLLRVRKDGSIGPLFVNRKQKIPIGEWMEAIDGKPKALANRPGFHCTHSPEAGHIKMRLKSGEERRWYEVEIKDYYEFPRPECQGGMWFIAKHMRIKKAL
jgi:hypothetical protein